MSCHGDACHVMFQSDPESRTDITIWRQLYTYNRCHTCTFVCYSYHEVRLFRYSAAVHVTKNYDEVGFGILAGDHFRLCICDNFDVEIYSPSYQICVHCLAMILALVQLPDNSSYDEVVNKKASNGKLCRIFLNQLRVIYSMRHMMDPKKPPEQANKEVLPLSPLATKVITTRRALGNVLFILSGPYTLDPKCPGPSNSKVT